VTFRPGFFRGGRTQVLLKAPFVMTTSAGGSLPGSENGAGVLEAWEKAGRGARGRRSNGLVTGSTAIDEDMLDKESSLRRQTTGWSDFNLATRDPERDFAAADFYFCPSGSFQLPQ
jgi:hypothetical protein